MPCSDLFRYLGNRRLSGSLIARRPGVEKRVVVHDGAAVSAASTDGREYLGQILINAGLLTAEQFEKAYRTQLETNVPLGQILVMIGLVPEEEIRRALAVKVRETALDLCDWRSGTFEFSSHAPTLQGGVPYAVPLLELCHEAEVRARAWTAMRRAIPSGATRFAPGPEARTDLAPASVEAQILRLAEQGRTAAEMMEALNATEYGFYQRLYALVQDGTLRVVDERSGARTAGDVETWFPEDTPAPREPRSSPADLLERARAALAEGAYAEAVELAGRAVERGADPAATALLQKAEGKLLAKLREELLSRPHVPSLVVDKAQIKAMPLTPPERYLLARMDGVRELGSVVRVAPLREVDALRLVKRFAREGLIRFS